MSIELALEGTADVGPVRAAPGRAQARGPALSAEVLHGATAWRELRDDWHRLADLQPGPVLFQMPAMLEAWSSHFAADRASALVTVVVRRENGQPVLIWPLFVERQSLVRVARGAGAPIGQYDELLLDPACDGAEALTAAVAALTRATRADLIVLERVRADGALRAAMGDIPPLNSAEAAPYADIADGPAKLMAGLKSRVVRQQRKRVRRFEQEGVAAFEVASDPEQAIAWLAEAMTLKREWLRTTGRVSRAFVKSETADCLADCARALALPNAAPRMVVSRLSLDGRTAAIEMGFCHRGVYHLYLGTFAPDAGKYGPGNILTERVLDWCAENGIRRYDMLAPRSRNKSEWQSGEVAVHDFALPTTLRGRLYVATVLRRLLPALRRAFYALPAPARSVLAGIALCGVHADHQQTAEPDPGAGAATAPTVAQ